MTETLCPFCGAWARRSCEMEDEVGFCPWDEAPWDEAEHDPDRLREDRDERRRMERDDD